MSQGELSTDPSRLFGMITGMVGAQAVYVAAELGIADHVKDSPRSPAELAQRTGAHPDSLHRLLRYLASEHIFAEDESGRFGLTPLAEMLRSDSPTRVRDVARMMGSEPARACTALLHSVKTGECAFEHVFGAPLFEYLGRHAEKAQVFDGAMIGIHGPETRPMIDAYDFSQFQSIVDIGGASGAVLLEVLRASPKSRGIAFDLPHIAEQGKARIAASDCAARCTAEGGDFFEAVPTGADCYMMRHIIHDWDDEKSAIILRRCREAMKPGGKVLVVEMVLPEGNEPHMGKMLDLVMLTCPGGRERTASEYDALFKRAGLKLTRIVPTASAVSVVEGMVA